MRAIWSAISVAALASCQFGARPALPLPPPPVIPEGEDPTRWSAALEAFDQEAVDLDRPVVFVGSSSIRLWSTLEDDMAPVPVLNRGYGGSKIFDTIYWADRLVARHDPTVIVAFTGTNDIKGDSPRTAEWVADRFDELVARFRALGCDAPLVYIAISPTPSRAEHLAVVLETNRMIRERCSLDDDLHFVDTASPLLDAEGQPDPSWFVKDRLHLNAEGYAAWTAEIGPVVHRLDTVERVGGR